MFNDDISLGIEAPLTAGVLFFTVIAAANKFVFPRIGELLRTHCSKETLDTVNHFGNVLSDIYIFSTGFLIYAISLYPVVCFLINYDKVYDEVQNMRKSAQPFLMLALPPTLMLHLAIAAEGVNIVREGRFPGFFGTSAKQKEQQRPSSTDRVEKLQIAGPANASNKTEADVKPEGENPSSSTNLTFGT